MTTTKILIVDDDSDVRETLARILVNGGLDVYQASGANSALAMLRTLAVDVVISDYDMPGMNGMNLLQLVRLTYPDALRVLLTGRATTQLAIRALNEQTAHRFLLKPWDRTDVMSIIQIALSGCHKSQPHRVVSPEC